MNIHDTMYNIIKWLRWGENTDAIVIGTATEVYKLYRTFEEYSQ